MNKFLFISHKTLVPVYVIVG